MIIDNVEIYSEESNFAVIRVKSRKYPGILIQGDSMLDLLATTGEVIELFDKDRDEAKEGLLYVYEQLQWRFENYQKVLKKNGMSVLEYTPLQLEPPSNKGSLE